MLKTQQKSSLPKNYSKKQRAEFLEDYRICCYSREASILGRKEVLTGKAKFGIFGDGKELPQVALSHYFQKGDWRSGYYRDQTLMFALGISSVKDLFAQLYADVKNDPFSGGRQMNSHFATPTVDAEGNWISTNNQYNVSSDISSTAGQMARGLGLALASKIYRNDPKLAKNSIFTDKGNEVVFVTIGDASTSEGVFWETMNAAAVQQVPLVVCVWDDGYGISVPKKYQTTKSSISKTLAGFQIEKGTNGVDIYKVKAWDYEGLRKTYETAIAKARKTHVPCLIHVDEVTQPQGHSTSGSHERYKSKERLAWEKKNDGIKKFKEWLIKSGVSNENELEKLRNEALASARAERKEAWSNYQATIKPALAEMSSIFETLNAELPESPLVAKFQKAFQNLISPTFAEILEIGRKMYFSVMKNDAPGVDMLKAWVDLQMENGNYTYERNLYSESQKSALNVPIVPAKYSEESKDTTGYLVLNAVFDHNLKEYPALHAFGEDVGDIGDVNQGFMGMQKKYGDNRVFDSGIREWTIMGQAIGMAMRGLRPIAEIQYIDYLIYGLAPLTDDLATLRWRSNGIQQSPAIIRTRGHRLEGIWHSGSPSGMMLSTLRGMYICVPRNMTQAAGMYNTLLQSNDPAIVVECLNGYRLKEKMPDNVGEFTVPLGMVETLQEGTDVTLVTYGSCVRIAQKGLKMLEEYDISVELIDIQTLLPFDMESQIVESLKKTNRIVFLDEDAPGGATAFMMKKVLEDQGGYRYLDSKPVTMTAKAHRPPYGSDGDYFSKPSSEDVFETIYNLMKESKPNHF